MRGFRKFSSHLTKCHACHGICTLSPLHAALTMRFAKNEPQDTSKVLRLPRKMKTDTSKVLHLPRKMQRIFLKLRKKYCICHTKRFSTRYETCLNVRKCHGCHAKRSTATLETSKSVSRARLRTGAKGCERLRTVAVVNAMSSEHTLHPRPLE